jgi:hypothetical protein
MMKLIAFHAPALPFDSSRIIVGGEARLALWCHLKEERWPQGYSPRDHDYLVISREKSSPARGLPRRGETDLIKAPSILSYFENIDLITNQVAVFRNRIVTTEGCVACFRRGSTVINGNHKKLALNGPSYFSFLLLRACIQTGFFIPDKVYLPRAGALKLPLAYEAEASRIHDSHWYWERYRLKMQMIASGSH